jgi:hypothetical protein
MISDLACGAMSVEAARAGIPYHPISSSQKTSLRFRWIA